MDELAKEAEQSNVDEGRGAKFSIWVSFCEIYNECIYDLLLPVSNDRRRKVLRLSQDVKGCSYVKGNKYLKSLVTSFSSLKVFCLFSAQAVCKLAFNSV